MRKLQLFAVAGAPILHSLSPDMFNAAFAHERIPAAYIRLHCSDAESTLQTVQQMGLMGLNATSPLKESLVPDMDSLSREAQAIGAVNVVKKKGRHWRGFNTDAEGVVGPLRNAGIVLEDARVVVLGGGGAAKAAAFGLKQVGARVTISNRSASKARNISRDFGCVWTPLNQTGLRKFLEQADALVSTIPSQEAVLPEGLLPKHLTVMDAVYGLETGISRVAKRRGCHLISGKEWLLHQGLASFEVLVGRKAPRPVMEAALQTIPARVVPKSVSLIGMMGCGKTAVASSLSVLSGWQAVDTDERVEQNQGQSVHDIFLEDGEEAFRIWESQALRQALATPRRVVSCGGGAVLSAKNRNALKKTTSVWLWATPETLSRRVNGSSRPLLQGHPVRNRLKTLLGERVAAYAQTASFVVSTESKSPKKIARMIWNEIH